MSRRLAVTQANDIEPPNFMIGSTNYRKVLPPQCDGDPEKWNGCFALGFKVPPHLYFKYLRR